MFGGLNPTNLVSQAALAVSTGGSSLIAQAALQIGTQVAKEVIANIGQQLGLPQPIIDAAEGALSAAVGDYAGAAVEYRQAATSASDLVDQYGQQFGASPSEIGDGQRQVNVLINDIVREASQSDDFKAARASGGKGGGWLMALAKALGSQLDQLGEQMEDMASRITKDTPGLSAQFGVVTQQFSMLMNATTNAIKTIGEAMGHAASKN